MNAFDIRGFVTSAQPTPYLLIHKRANAPLRIGAFIFFISPCIFYFFHLFIYSFYIPITAPPSFQSPLTQPLPMSHAPCPLPFSSEKWKPLHINSPGSSCWETQMKSKLHICYIDAGGLGSAHACSLVSGSYIYNRHNYSLWGFKTVSGNLHQVLCLWFLIFPLYCPNCRD